MNHTNPLNITIKVIVRNLYYSTQELQRGDDIIENCEQLSTIFINVFDRIEGFLRKDISTMLTNVQKQHYVKHRLLSLLNL